MINSKVSNFEIIVHTLNNNIPIKQYLFYSLLIVSTILYIYRVEIYNYNITLFRIIFIIWVIFFIKDIILKKKRVKKTYVVFILIYFLVLVVNIIDIFRVYDENALIKDNVNHLVNMFLVYLVITYINTESKIDNIIHLYILGSLIALLISAYTILTDEIPLQSILKSIQSDKLPNLSLVIYYGSMIRLFLVLFTILIFTDCTYAL